MRQHPRNYSACCTQLEDLYNTSYTLQLLSCNMAPAKTGKAAAPTAKKEKIAHPQSRKAGQIARKSLRKGKMGNMVSTRHKKHNGMGKCRLVKLGNAI